MYLIEYYREYNNRLYLPSSKDYTLIIKDLKEIQDVKNRAKEYAPNDTVYYQIIYATDLNNIKSYATKHRELINTEWEGK